MNHSNPALLLVQWRLMSHFVMSNYSNASSFYMKATFFKSLECQFCFEKINYRISSKFRSWFKGDNRAQLFQNPQKWVNQWSWYSGQMVAVQHAVILDVNHGYHPIYASLEGQMGLIVKDFRKNRLTKPKRKYLSYKAYMKNKLINLKNFGKLTLHIQCFLDP